MKAPDIDVAILWRATSEERSERGCERSECNGKRKV